MYFNSIEEFYIFNFNRSSFWKFWSNPTYLSIDAPPNTVYGQAKASGQGTQGGGYGGAGGKAIALNGNTVTFIAGNNSTQVMGAVS